MRLLAPLAAGLLAGSLMAAPVPKDKVKDEEAVLGTWQVEGFDVGGSNGPPAEVVAKLRFTFTKDGKMVSVGPDGKEKVVEFKLDSSAKPKAIDTTTDGSSSLGIYELDGDTLKMCLNQGNEVKRPTEFKGDGKKFTFVMTMTRVKDEKKDK